MNPSNCPELCPIESFWAIVKRNLRKNSSPATNEANLKIKWKKVEDMLTRADVQALMRGVKSKVRQFFHHSKYQCFFFLIIFFN
jgi:transposase